MRIGNLLASASDFFESSGCFFGHGTDNAWDEAVFLLLWAMDLDEDPGESVLSERIGQLQAKKFEEAINLRASEKIPAPYITGEAWFCGLRFSVDQNVLVPRSPIAELIQNAYRPWITKHPRKILDLCCGSGCIGIAAAISDQEAEVILADLSSDALVIAQKNIDRYRLSSRVKTSCGDLFAPLTGESFDLILANPPYVNAVDLADMPMEYRQEPTIGLGSGEEGLDISIKILQTAGRFLNDGGVLILEVGNSWISLERAYPEFPFTWIEFSQGGWGVCAITKEELETFTF